MLLIALLMVITFAGLIYGLYLLRRDRQGRVAALIEELERGALSGRIFADEEPQPGESGKGKLERLRKYLPTAMMESYAERLLWAGRPSGLDAAQFVSLKLVSAGIFGSLIPVLSLFHLDALTLLAMAVSGIFGFVLPDMWLNGKLDVRKRQVQEELPLFADLIATAVSAGLSLTEAVRRVAADMDGLVAREFLRSVQEMAAGKPRLQAWRDLTDRVPGDEFRTIVNAIMQAEQYGTSVSELLRYQVQQIRTFKQQEAQRLAQAATVKMRIPMLLLILVPFMVLLLGPALLQIGHLLS